MKWKRMPPVTNLLLTLSDEDNPHAMACPGHHGVPTPNLDALTASVTRFTHASFRIRDD